MARGRGGVWPMMTSSKKSKICGKFLEIYREFFQNFPQNLQIQDKNFQPQVNLNLAEFNDVP